MGCALFLPLLFACTVGMLACRRFLGSSRWRLLVSLGWSGFAVGALIWALGSITTEGLIDPYDHPVVLTLVKTSFETVFWLSGVPILAGLAMTLKDIFHQARLSREAAKAPRLPDAEALRLFNQKGAKQVKDIQKGASSDVTP